MIETRVSLPYEVGERWEELLERYVELPDDYDHSEAEVAHFAECKNAQRKRLKTRTAYTLRHYGEGDYRTKLTARVLKDAIYDAYDLLRDITERHEESLQAMRERWIKRGEFRLPPKPKKSVNPELQAHREAMKVMINEMVDHACNMLRRKQSPITPNKDFRSEMKVNFSWSENRRCSRGGLNHQYKPDISLSLRNYDSKKDRMLFREYHQIRKSPVIGSMAGPWHVHLAAIVAHEVAHAVQYNALHRRDSVMSAVGYRSLDKPHGQGWQEIYRYLRSEWVNQLAGYESLAGK